MASRRDLIQGYQFAARRVVSAVVMRQTDPTEWPFRRLGGAGFGTIMAAVIALAAVGIYGMIVPGGKTTWKDGKSVIVEKETGTPYVYIDGELHPVLNFSSAALLAGTTQITAASHASLIGYKRGVELGISGAPGALPTSKQLVAPPWSLCTERLRDSKGVMRSRTTLVVGKRADTGDPPGDQVLLVTNTDDAAKHLPAEYLVWRDRRYLVTDTNSVGVALHLDNQVNVNVGGAWLKALQEGENIGPLPVDGAGQASTAVPGATIGEIFQVGGTVGQYYLAERTELLPISDFQAQIQLAQDGAPAQAKQLGAGDAAAAPKAEAPSASKEQPPTSSDLNFVRPVSSDVTLCATYQNNSFDPQVLVNSTVPARNGIPTEEFTGAAAPLADRVWVPPGKAALVEPLTSPDNPDGPVLLVTDEGEWFAIPNSDALSALGYSSAAVSKLPASLLARMPSGPALDPDAARAAMAIEENAD